MIKASDARDEYYNHRKKQIESKVKRVLLRNKILRTKTRYIWLKDGDLPYLDSWIEEELGFLISEGYTPFLCRKKYKMYW